MEMRPGYKHTYLGSIPVDWEVKKLSLICSMKSGDGITIHDIDERSMYPCYGGNGLRGYTNRYTHDGYYALIGRQGALCGNVLGVKGKFFASEHAVVVTASPDTDVGWLTYLLGEMHLNRYSESSAQPGLSVAKLQKLEVVVPSDKIEQRAIAEALSDVDALIDSLDKLIAKKRNIKQGAMQELLTGKKRLPGFSGKWEMKRLGDVTDSDPENLGSDTHPDLRFKYIALEDVDRGTLAKYSECLFGTAPSRARRKLRKYDILVSTVRPNLKSHLLFTRNEDDWVCSTGFCVLRCRDGVTYPGYVYFQVFGHYISRQIEALLAGSNYPAINSADVRALEAPFPEYNEQTAIAEVLSDMDAEISALEQRRDKTVALKQGMMQELLTGRTRLV